MTHLCFRLCFLLLHCLSVFSSEFSHSTREYDIALLEHQTLPLREKLTRFNDTTLSLVDFLASAVGLRFLNSHKNGLSSQRRLDREYRRYGICENLKNENKKRPLSSGEKRFRNCVCSPSKPYLHCLAIGSQLLKRQGYDRQIDVLEASPSFSLIPKEILPLRIQSSMTSLFYNKGSESSPCVPHCTEKSKHLCYGGQCNVPIGKILDIRIDDFVCFGDEKLTTIDMEKCQICIPSGPASGCHDLCKDDVELLENMITIATGNLTANICIDLGRIGVLFHLIFGGDNCFEKSTILLSFYERVLLLDIDQGHSSLKLKAQLEYKYDYGPHCICDLSKFRCLRSCKMQREDVIGSLTVSWDYFFASGTYTRSWNEPQKCYTEFQHTVKECETKV